MVQGLALLNLVDTGRVELSLKTHELALLRFGHLHVVLGENCDHISRFELEVLTLVTGDGLPQIEGQQPRTQIFGKDPLDHGVFPIYLGAGSLDFVLEFFLLDPLRLGPPNLGGEILTRGNGALLPRLSRHILTTVLRDRGGRILALGRWNRIWLLTVRLVLKGALALLFDLFA